MSICRYPNSCLPNAPINVQTALVADQDLQRLVNWTAPQSSIPITGYNVSCNTTFEALSDVRTIEVSGSFNAAIIGNGTGDNAPLEQGRTYSCSVTAQNAAGSSSPATSSTFTTYVGFEYILNIVCTIL